MSGRRSTAWMRVANRLIILITMALVATGVTVLPPAPASADLPKDRIELSATTIQRGTSVQLTAVGLVKPYTEGPDSKPAAGDVFSIQLVWGYGICNPGPSIARFPNATADATGGFSVRLTIPSNQPTTEQNFAAPGACGPYNFHVVNTSCGCGKTVYSDRVVITGEAPPPPPPPPPADPIPGPGTSPVIPVPGPGTSPVIPVPGPARYDLAVTMSGPLTATTDAFIPYIVNVRNKGPATAPSVILVDVLENNGVATGNGFDNATVGPTGHGACTLSAGRMVCDLHSLAPGEEVAISLRTRALASGYLVNTASVDTANDPNPGDNSASVLTTVQDSKTATADISVTQNFSTGITTGPRFGYDWLVKNNGPDLATNVTFQSLSVTEPGGNGVPLEIVGPSGVCGSGLRCNLGTMSSGSSVVVTVWVQIPRDGAYSNTVEVSADQRDGALGNNQAKASIAADTGGVKEIVNPCALDLVGKIPAGPGQLGLLIKTIRELARAEKILILLQDRGYETLGPEERREVLSKLVLITIGMSESCLSTIPGGRREFNDFIGDLDREILKLIADKPVETTPIVTPRPNLIEVPARDLLPPPPPPPPPPAPAPAVAVAASLASTGPTCADTSSDIRAEARDLLRLAARAMASDSSPGARARLDEVTDLFARVSSVSPSAVGQDGCTALAEFAGPLAALRAQIPG